MYENLFKTLEKPAPLRQEVKDLFISTIKIKNLEKNEILLKEGKICDHIYFIEKGLLRSYYHVNNEDVTSWFMKENDIIISVKSFYTRTPSYETIEPLEKPIVYSMDFTDLEKIYKLYPEFNLNGRLLTTYYYMLSEERLYFIRKQKAEDRYKFLLTKHPEIIQRAPLKYIASYLGIATETLSRIRGNKN